MEGMSYVRDSDGEETAPRCCAVCDCRVRSLQTDGRFSVLCGGCAVELRDLFALRSRVSALELEVASLRQHIFATEGCVAAKHLPEAHTDSNEKLLVGFDDGSVRRLSISSGEFSSSGLPKHSDPVGCISASCGLLVYGCDDGSVVVSGLSEYLDGWTARHSSGIEAATVDHAVLCVARMPDGRVVSGGDDRIIRVWSHAGEPQINLEGHEGAVHCVKAIDERRVLSGSGDSTLRLWNVAVDYSHSESAVSNRCCREFQGHSGTIYGIVVMDAAGGSDGKTAVSASHDGTLRVWNVDSGHCEATLQGHTGPVLAVGGLVDYVHVVSASADATLRLWNILTCACVRVLDGHCDAVRSLAVSVDGSTIVSCSDDGEIMVWSASDGNCAHTISCSAAPCCMAFLYE